MRDADQMANVNWSVVTTAKPYNNALEGCKFVLGGEATYNKM